jgi:hypothetical protein
LSLAGPDHDRERQSDSNQKPKLHSDRNREPDTVAHHQSNADGNHEPRPV